VKERAMQSLEQNGLLSRLAPSDRDVLRPLLKAVQLPRRERLAARGERPTAVWFPTAGIASIVGQVAHEPPMEIAVVGHEGFVGLPVLLGDGVSQLESFMQVEGAGWRLAADRLEDAMHAAPRLRTTLLRYAEVSRANAASTILANGRARTAERLARWLVMCHDRVASAPLPLTHELLGYMLGVRRPSVSVAVGRFEQAGLIEQGRGRIAIVDRAGLETIAGPYYGMAEAEYDRLLGPAK
jgi:CRP-like cAMP-binding protein